MSRGWSGRLLALAAGLGTLLLAEMGLRLAGVGVDDRLFVAEGKQYRLNPRAARRFFPPQYARLAPAQDTFPREKPEGVCRIFALGASTLLGFPNPPGTAFPNFLKLMLEDAYAERDFEVVNCGVTAINSFALLDFVEEVVHYQPDLILIYAGHNEFVGPYGVTTPFVRVGNNWHLIRAHMFLQRLRLYQGLRELLDAASLWRGGGKEQDFGLHLVRREVYLDSQEHRATEANYRRNLGEIVRLARQRGVPVLLSTLVSNVQGFYPLRSQGPHPDLKGTILEPGKRMAFYTAILEKFPHHAAAHFEAGQVFAGAGDFERAQWAFARARDLDAIHLRACSPFNRIIREVARDKGVILVDSEQVFGKHSPRGLVGNELVAEYLHPSVYGHYLMAQGMVEVLVEHQQALDLEGGNAERLASFEEYARRLGYSPRQQVHARNDLILFLRNMPYQERPQVLRQRLAELVAAQLAELPGLSYGEILDFARRGGLYFLEETIALVEEGDQAPLREKLEDLARPLGLDPRAGPGR